MVLFPGNVVAQAAEAMQRALAEIRVWAGEAPPATGVDLSTAIGTDAFMCRFN
jgi:hypothetical protein